jgi:rhodanese-related sulfurtransferase
MRNQLHVIGIMLLSVFIFSNSVLAKSDENCEQIRKIADQYLSSVPENGYHVSADELLKRIQSGKNDFVIVDAREKIEKYNVGHIPGAIYISFRNMAKEESLAKLPKDKDIILYCNTGHEQNKALSALRMMGYKAFALKFGYMAWKNEKPTEAALGVLDNASKKSYPVEK